MILSAAFRFEVPIRDCCRWCRNFKSAALGVLTMATFRAILIRKADDGQSVGLADFDEKDLMDGDVTVRIDWSTVNYKDGLALTGKAPVVRDRKSTRLNSSHPSISYAVFCLK